LYGVSSAVNTWTFLFTDIEDSTGHYERSGAIYREAAEQHFGLLKERITAHGGRPFRNTGDGLLAAFEDTDAALDCARACQCALRQVCWPPEIGELRVRIGLHRGETEQGDGDFHGLTMHHATRVLDAAHGGQVLCSATVFEHAGKKWRGELGDLGLYRLRGVAAPVRLFQIAYEGMPSDGFPPVRTRAAFTHSLPVAPTRFFGREAELHDLLTMLGPEISGPSTRRYGRLVTLLGPGGTGKTRLSLAAAERMLPAYSHAVWFVPLAEVSEAALLPDVLRDALGVAHEPGVVPLDQVAAMLSAQPSLLVLDNFEQLVPSGVETVRVLLERLPNLVCLVSSRTRLDLGAEQEFSLDPLRLPPAAGSVEELLRYPSVQLFCDRAKASRREFRLTPENAGDVAQLCRALEGVPLAIELAAARAAVLTPRQMQQRLGQRLDFLSGGRRDLPERHRSLRAAIAWSYELLALPLRRVFARLSIFRGGWSLESAQAIAAEAQDDALDLLTELRACSLIQVEEAGGAMRYRMLEVLRDYAAERLRIEGSGDDLELRFHAWFFHLTGNEPPLEQAEHFERLASDHDNLRAMLAGRGPIEERLRAAVRLYPFWMTRGFVREGRDWLRRLSDEAKDVPGAPLPAAANAAGILAWKAADYERAEEHLAAALRHWERVGNERNIAGVLNNLALVATDRGDFETARKHLEGALEIYRRGEATPELAAVLNNLGESALRLGDADAAQAWLEESVAVERSFGDQSELANALHNLSEAHLLRGDLAEARRHLAECLALRVRLGSRDLWVASFCTLAAIARAEQRLSTAVTLYSAASHHLERAEENPGPEARGELAREVGRLRAQLDSAAFTAAWRLGPALGLAGLLDQNGQWRDDLATDRSDISAAPENCP
jgi:predicted ATPase/class 3 adenylate cyclase/Tfp pilus assembly protein PilF